nr:MAG TPA: hypothetical protein [Caudoviricetes sp.]
MLIFRHVSAVRLIGMATRWERFASFHVKHAKPWVRFPVPPQRQGYLLLMIEGVDASLPCASAPDFRTSREH